MLLLAWCLNLHLHLMFRLTLLHSERPKLYTILAFLSAMGLKLFKDNISLAVDRAT